MLTVHKVLNPGLQDMELGYGPRNNRDIFCNYCQKKRTRRDFNLVFYDLQMSDFKIILSVVVMHVGI